MPCSHQALAPDSIELEVYDHSQQHSPLMILQVSGHSLAFCRTPALDCGPCKDFHRLVRFAWRRKTEAAEDMGKGGIEQVKTALEGKKKAEEGLPWGLG